MSFDSSLNLAAKISAVFVNRLLAISGEAVAARLQGVRLGLVRGLHCAQRAMICTSDCPFDLNCGAQASAAFFDAAAERP